MPKNLNSASPAAIFLQWPLARMAEMPLLPAVAGAGLFANAAKLLTSDPFTLLLPLVLAAAGFDWWYGRRQARILGTFKAEIATIGLHQKIGAIGILCFIRWLEWQGGTHIFETNGMVALIIAFGMILEELSSVEDKRIDSGGKPIFMLSAAFTLFRGILQRLMPGGQPPPPPAAQTPVTPATPE